MALVLSFPVCSCSIMLSQSVMLIHVIKCSQFTKAGKLDSLLVSLSRNWRINNTKVHQMKVNLLVQHLVEHGALYMEC